jgi:heme o synthase
MVPVSLTGFTGYFIFDPHITIRIFIITFGILILAISASVLNQVLEVDLDSRMRRTQDRPLPSGKIALNQAIILFIFSLLSGIFLICLAGNLTAALIGIFTVIWYNGIYTYTKRLTAFAVFPGAVTGALPPLIGWVAAGGGILDKPIIFVEFVFFIGQVPHFWLLIMRYGEEYEKAGIPCLTRILSRSQINRLTFTWVVTSLIAALFLCHFGIIQSGLITGILITASLVLIWQFSGLFKMTPDKNNFRKYSILLESYFLLLLLLLISDRILI